MMSLSHSASDLSLASSSSQDETFGLIDRLGEKRTKLDSRYRKYESRLSYLVNKIKIERAKLAAQIVPPPSIPLVKEVRSFNSNKIDDRLYSEVAALEISNSSDEEIILDVPIVKSNLSRINYLQKQINITKWRLEKCHNQLIRLSHLETLNNSNLNRTNIEAPVIEINNSPYVESEIVVNLPFRGHSISIKNKKNCKSRVSINDDSYGIYTPRFISKERNPFLLKLIRFYIQQIRIKKKHIKLSISYPQMDAHGEDSISQDQHYNTNITTQRESSSAEDKPNMNWASFVTSDPLVPYSTILDRWTLYDVATWKNDSISISEIKVFKDIFSKLSNTPIAVPFRNYRYWKGDLEFKIVINSNKFQVGCLQISYLYSPDYEYSLPQNRLNVYNLSQTNHCLINAGSSNEGVLTIPFKYFNPLVTTQMSEVSNICHIYIKALNKLICTSTSYNTAEVSIFVRVTNALFTGTISQELVNPQMFHLIRAMVKTTEFGLNQIAQDNNRDLPPDNIPPLQIHPHSSSSFCVGKNSTNPSRSLRLDSTGQTPHPSYQDEMKIQSICQVFGLFSIIEWSQTQDTGSLIYTMEAAPVASYSHYNKSSVNVQDKTINIYSLPPVAVISSLFSYWRGTLQLRIDVVASMFHTGSILVSYIPGPKQSKVSLNMAKSSNYIICNIQESQSFTINIPYITNSLYWDRKYNPNINSESIKPPGYVYILVLNRLIPNDQVPGNVYLNLYLRAGDDFEVAVPIQPNISTPYNLMYRDNKFNQLVPISNVVDNSILMYFGNAQTDSGNTWVPIREPKGERGPMDYTYYRDGQADAVPPQACVWPVIQYTGEKFKYYLKIPNGIFLKTTDQTNNLIEYAYLYNETGGYSAPRVIMFFCLKEEFAKKYVKSNQTWADVLKYMYKANSDAGGYDVIKTNYFEKVYIDNVKEEFEYVMVQNEERTLNKEIISMSGSLKSSSAGLMFFGEQFNDLKDYCRRFQYYTSCSINKTDINYRKKISVKIPILPQGLVNSLSNTDGTINHIVNRSRDGFIPLISSGFRFYRGSIRFKIVVQLVDQGNIWVQHRPEASLSSLSLIPIHDDDNNLGDYYNHAYSTVVQNLSINNFVEIEVPWYKRNVFNYSFLPKIHINNVDALNSFSLGDLVIGFDNIRANNPISLEVYYAIADDFRFNTMQGFPMMLPLKSIPDVGLPQMGLFNLLDRGDAIVEKAENLINRVTNMSETTDSLLASLPELVKTTFGSISSTVVSIIIDVFSQLVHGIINPTIGTISFAICVIFTKLGLISYIGLQNFKIGIVRFFQLVTGHSSRPEQQEAGAVPQSDEELDEVCAGLGSMLWSGLTSLLSVNFKKCATIKSYFGELRNGIQQGMVGGNIVYRFIKNNFVFLEKCYKFIVKKTYCKYQRYIVSSEQSEDIISWLELCSALLSPANYSKIQNDPSWRESLYSAARFGHIYLSYTNENKVPKSDFYVRKIYSEIVKLRDAMLEEKLFPSLRQEAYGLWIDGEPGIGKSSMVTKLSFDLLSSIQYQGSSDLIFNLNPTDRYWSNCKNQPVVLIDDAFAITTPEAVASQLWAYFQIMSPVPLIPPMAELSEKKNHYNPEIFITCSNNAFPKLSGLQEHDALYRRRHQLIKAELVNPEIKKYPFGFTPDEVNELKHLKFKIALNVRDEKTSYTNWKTYAELKEFLSQDIIKFKQQAQIAYEERRKLQFAFWPDTNPPNFSRTINETIEEYNKRREEQYNNSSTTLGSISILNNENSRVFEFCKEKVSYIKLEISKLFTKVITLGQIKVEECTLTEEEAIQLHQEAEEADDGTPVVEAESFKEFDKIELDHFKITGNLDFNYSNVSLTFSNYVSLCISKAEELGDLSAYPIKSEDLWDKLNNCYNKTTSFRINNPHPNIKVCYHEMLEPSDKLIIVKINGYNIPLWEIPLTNVGLNFVRGKPDLIAKISDCPCGIGCIILRNYKLWLELVAKWYKGNKFFNEILRDPSIPPIISKLRKCESATKKFISSAIMLFKKYGKILITDILCKAFHWLGSFFSNFYVFFSGFACLLATISFVAKPQLISSGDSTTSKFSGIRQLTLGKFQSANCQSNDQNSLYTVILKRVLANTIYLNFTDHENARKSSMKCLIIKERFMIIIKHYKEYIENNTTNTSKLELMWDTGCIPYTLGEISWCSNSNLGIVRLPYQVSAKKSLIPFLMPRSKHKFGIQKKAEILDVQLNKTVVYENDIELTESLIIAPTSYSETLIIPFAYKYTKNYPGMCGSLLLTEHTQTPIIGIHVAGSSGKGYSEPISMEQFIDFFDETVKVPIDWRQMDIPSVPVEEQTLTLDGSHVYLGTVDQFYKKNQSGETQIIKSELYNLFPITSEPGPLSSKDPRILNQFSPLLEGCKKNCNPTIDFDPIHLKESFNHLNSVILNNCEPLRLTVNPLSEMDAVNGLDIKYYDKIVMNTSEGFPLSRFRPKGSTDKSWLFSFNEDRSKVVGIHARLRHLLDSKANDRDNCIVPLTIHDDCLKDARIKLRHIQTPGKVRVFSVSPIDFTIQFRQYFLDFIASYTNTRFKAEHAIGINIHGKEWSDLANLMKGKKIITGDYSGFGPTLNSNVVAYAFKIINNWYHINGCCERDNNIRNIMSYELINSKHLMLDYLYEVNCGLPSGNPATVIFNSLVNSMYIRCAWLDIMQDTTYNSLIDFSNCCTLITYGDDLIMSVKECVINKFNNNTLSYFFDKHNIKFTDAAKTGVNVEPYIEFIDSTFLKHSFLKHPYRANFYLAKLDEDSVTDCVSWIRKSNNITPKEATKEACIQASMLSYGHGEDYYYSFIEKIKQAWFNKYKETLYFRSWKQLDELFIDQEFYFNV